VVRDPPDSPHSSDLRIYARLLYEARRYWGHIACLLLLSMLAAPMALLTPLPLKIAVDSVVGNKPLPDFFHSFLPGFATSSRNALLILAAVLFVLVALVSALQDLSSTVLGTYVGEKLQMQLRERLFRHVQRLSLVYHDAAGTADSVYRIQYDAQSIQWIAVYGVTPFLGSAVTLGAMIYVTARIDGELAVVALSVAPVLFVLTRLFRRRLRTSWKTTKALESSALSVVQEVLTGLRVVKVFGQEAREHERFVRQAGESMRARIRQGAFGLMIALATAAGSASVLYIGIRHVESGRLSLGSLLLVIGYLSQLYGPLRTISATIGTLQSSLASAERVFTILEEPEDVVERPHARHIGRVAGTVTFRNVSFSYPTATAVAANGRPAASLLGFLEAHIRDDEPRLVLSDVSFEIPAGGRVGVTGATGAGKTTLAGLLMRLYDPTAGAILLDGVDIRELRVADLRNQFAIVLQEPVLFSTSIAENIAYGRPSASREQIVEAARAANVHDFIAGLPDGYETLVGERGMRLSGGERQRVSLARAFLKDAPILILDEPTSAVDMKTEAEIMAAMARLMDGRTTFLITHRLSTLADCDVRLELEDGRLVAVGGAGELEVVATAVAGGARERRDRLAAVAPPASLDLRRPPPLAGTERPEHLAAPTARPPWRRVALFVLALATLELAGFVAIAVVLLNRTPAREAAVPPVTRTVYVRDAPAPIAPALLPKTPVPAPLAPRARTRVLVLNGNGIAGAAARSAALLHARGYRVTPPANAPSHADAASVVMYEPGFRREAARLARDLHVTALQPLDPAVVPAGTAADLVLLLGAHD
jgi:ATP-binding cassette, subfamily B, bacterial